MSHGASFVFNRILALFAIVTHLLYIAPSWDIRLRRESPSVTILTHSKDIRWYHPLECIGIHLPEPSIHIMRMISPEEGIIPDDHESLDVVWVVLWLDSSEYRIYAVHSRDISLILPSPIVPPSRWKWVCVIECILTIERVIVVEIELPHILSPSEDLPDESFYTRKWCMPSECCFDDF